MAERDVMAKVLGTSKAGDVSAEGQQDVPT